MPIVKTTRQLNKTFQTNNVWFFDPNGTPFDPSAGFNNCTFGNPCSQFSQVVIDGINGLTPNAHFFIDTGGFNNPLAGTGFNLYYGQNINRRTNHFFNAATGSDRPLLNDTLVFEW